MAYTGRNHAAVRNMLAQLGFTDDFQGGVLPADKAALVVRALSGGKKRNLPPAAPAASTFREAATPVSLDTPSAVRTRQAGTAQPIDDPNPANWTAAPDFITEFRCSPAALSLLIAHEKNSGAYIRRADDGTVLLHKGLIKNVRLAAKKAGNSRDGWMRSPMLAKQVGVEPHELPHWLKVAGIEVGEDARVAHYFGQKVEFEVIYSERVWGRALEIFRRRQKGKS